MKRINILGNLASAAPKIAVLATIFTGFMIGGSTLVSAKSNPKPNPTPVALDAFDLRSEIVSYLQCEQVGGVPSNLVIKYYWFWEPTHENTGVPCSTQSN
jgi:hypothetical protein